jgi:threonine aldolase
VNSARDGGAPAAADLRGTADFRSDTVTRPCAAMRAAMAAAAVGDDVLGDDPTVLRLQERVAAMCGMEAALFVPSGTMGNQIAVKLHTQPGEELICEERSHVWVNEAGGLGLISGVQTRTLCAPSGCPEPAAIEAAVRDADVHHPRSALVVLENTHNYAGGRVIPVERMAAIRAVALRRGMKVHLDGARLWNAVVATRTPIARFAEQVDTLTFCFSKGLGCPVGSMVAGSRTDIERARRIRKALGGGMRQVGILAAAAEFALDHLVERLAEDHARARRLATAFAALPGCRVDAAAVETNIVFVERPAGDAPELERRLAAQGVAAIALAADRLRFVTHRDVGDAEVARAIAAMGTATQALAAPPGKGRS